MIIESVVLRGQSVIPKLVLDCIISAGHSKLIELMKGCSSLTTCSLELVEDGFRGTDECSHPSSKNSTHSSTVTFYLSQTR